MPIFLQVIANVQPTKFFLIIVRSVILKGIGIGPVWEQYAWLALFTFVMVAVSSVRLHRELSA
jgi:ABC-2 type transport system permease protein